MLANLYRPGNLQLYDWWSHARNGSRLGPCVSDGQGRFMCDWLLVLLDQLAKLAPSAREFSRLHHLVPVMK